MTPRVATAEPVPPAPRLPAGERVYAIGDVHGRLDLLEALVRRIRTDGDGRPPARIRLVLLGDLVDRGPDSAGVVARLMALAARMPRLVVLRGNHEAMMVHAVRGNYIAMAAWLRNGGDAALASYGVDRMLVSEGPSPALMEAARAAVPDAVLRWLAGLPLSLRLGDYLFVHAGIRPGVPLAEQTEEDMLWIRGDFTDSEDLHSAMVVHGHSIEDARPAIRRNRIGIDTGAYRTGVLTALGMEGADRWVIATEAETAQPPAARPAATWAAALR